MRQFQAFLGNRDQHISANGDPNLRLHCVLGLPVERLDPQMLLDPFEEQLDLPALAIELRDQRGFETEVVGQKRNPLARLVFDHHPAQRLGVVFAGVVHREHTRLIAHHAGVDSVDRLRVAPLELSVALGTRHEEGARLMNHKQALEVQVVPVEQIERSRLQSQLVQRIDFVRLAICEVNESGNRAPQIQQRVQLDSSLGRAKRCPRKHRQTQIDGRCIEGIDHYVQIERQWLAGVQRPGQANQVLGQIGVDLPWAHRIRIGQRVARDRLAAKAHVIQPLALSAQVDFDIAQGLAVGQLGEGHGIELIQAVEVLDFEVAVVVGHTAAKGAHWQMRHELGKHELALMHGGVG